MFDPVPTTNTQITVTTGGRTYIVVAAVPISGGALNEVFEAGAAVAGEIFGTETTFNRLKTYYDKLNDTDVAVSEGALTSSDVPPPTPYSIRDIDGSNVLAHDVRLMVPGAVLGDTVNALYDLQLRG